MTLSAGLDPGHPAAIAAAPKTAPDATAIGNAADDWHASLSLGFAYTNGRTTLVDNRHDGPLVVQKPLYPDGDARCETVIVHPPGGIAGGDRLSIGVEAGPGTEILLTTPGATRWYKSNGRLASQRVHVVARANAIVEW